MGFKKSVKREFVGDREHPWEVIATLAIYIKITAQLSLTLRVELLHVKRTRGRLLELVDYWYTCSSKCS